MARPRQHSDQELLDAARLAFLEHGPGVSTTVIAAQVGMSQAALFKRFGTKRKLMLRALMPSEEPAWIQKLAGGPDDRPIPEQLAEIGALIGHFMEEMVPCISIVRASGLDMHEIFEEFETPLPLLGRRRLEAWLLRAQDSGRMGAGNCSVVAAGLMGAMQARAFLMHLNPDEFQAASAEDYAHQLVGALWAGLAPEDAR